jgi:hypothetical protein
VQRRRNHDQGLASLHGHPDGHALDGVVGAGGEIENVSKAL